MFHKTFLVQSVRESYEPIEWWENALTEPLPPRFHQLIRKLFNLPAGSGGIERSFSTLGNIMTKQRNRLSIEKASKLCTIHNHFKLMEHGKTKPRSAKTRSFPITELNDEGN